MVFVFLAQVPGIAIWFSKTLPVGVRAVLVTAAFFVFSLAIVENFLKKFSMHYADIGIKPAGNDWVKTNVVYGFIGAAIGFVWYITYLWVLKVITPDMYAKLAADKTIGYIQFMMDWARTYSMSGTIMIFAAMLLLAVGEELIFRGLIFGYLNRESTSLKAVLWSSGCFAIIHLNPVNMPSSFVLGIVLVLTYKRTGSLLAPIIAHCVYNLSIVYLGKFLY